MKTLVIFCEALRNRAGIERMTVDIANLLHDNYNTIIISINSFSQTECPYSINDAIKVISLNSEFNKSFYSLNLRNIRLLRSYLKQIRPAFLISVATPLVRIAAPAAMGFNIRVIGWEHFNIFAGSKLGTLYKAIAPWAVYKTIVLTEADAKDYRRFYAPRIEVIPNFTTIGINNPSDCSSNIILAVGRHAYQKGFDMLLKAWAKTNAPGWNLRIVGSGKDKESNMKLAEKLNLTNRVEFRDSTANIEQEFQNASCFVLSSRFEGLVLVLIEAKMMGLPTICFDCPNSPREVVRDGVDGKLVPPANIDLLAQTMTKMLMDKSKLAEMGMRGREDAISRYSPTSIKKAWMKILS